jgi:hypothetical protein
MGSSDQCILKCNTSENAFTVYFTITPYDMDPGYTNIQTYYNDLKSLSIFKVSSVNANTNLNTFFSTLYPQLSSLNPSNVYSTPNCVLSSTNNGGIIMYLYYYFVAFGISPRRLCDVTFTPKPYNYNIQVINVAFTISSSNSTDNGRNDSLSAKCLGEWMLDYFKQFDKTIQTTFIANYIPRTESIRRTNCQVSPVVSAPKPVTSAKPTGQTGQTGQTDPGSSNIIPPVAGAPITGVNTFTSSVNYEKFSPINYTKDTINIGVEQFSNTGGYPGLIKSTNPVTIFDYIFQYSYIISLVGAIFYAVMAISQVNIGDIIINKNIILAFNIYFSLCGFISFCVWYNIHSDIIDSKILNTWCIKTS